MKAKAKIFTPYVKSHDEAYFDLVNQKDNYDTAYNNTPNNAQTEITNSNIQHNPNNRSIFLSQTITEPESNQNRRMSTAQKLLNDPKLRQIRIFMNEHRKEKNNEEEDNGYKRSKSLMMPFTKHNSNIDKSDNEELQMIKENKKENDINEIKNLKTGINNNSLEMKKRKIIALRRSYNKEINHDEFQKEEPKLNKLVVPPILEKKIIMKEKEVQTNDIQEEEKLNVTNSSQFQTIQTDTNCDIIQRTKLVLNFLNGKPKEDTPIKIYHKKIPQSKKKEKPKKEDLTESFTSRTETSFRSQSQTSQDTSYTNRNLFYIYSDKELYNKMNYTLHNESITDRQYDNKPPKHKTIDIESIIPHYNRKYNSYHTSSKLNSLYYQIFHKGKNESKDALCNRCNGQYMTLHKDYV